MVSTINKGRGTAPMERVEQNPWGFLGLALAVGVAAGALMRFKLARRAIKWYVLYKRFL